MAGVPGIALSTYNVLTSMYIYSIQGHCMNLQGTVFIYTTTVWRHTKGWNVECRNNTAQHHKMNNFIFTYCILCMCSLFIR